MKIIVFFIALLFASQSYAESITLYSQGTDLENAKKTAFKNAIETVCGVDVLTKREHLNNEVSYDNIATHSHCRIRDYKVLETYNDPYRIKIQVQIQNTKKDDRFFSEGNGYRFSLNLQESLDDFNREKQSGDDLIKLAFKDYPYHAYNITNIQDPYITSNDRKNLYLIVDYKLTWNYNFIKSMRNVLDFVSSNTGNNKVVIMAKDTNVILLGSKTIHYINDVDRYDLIKQQFSIDKEFRVRVRVRDTAGKTIIDTCHLPKYKQGSMFYHLNYNNNLTVFGNDIDVDKIIIKINVPLSSIFDVSVDVAAAKDCKL